MAISENNGDLTQTGDSNETLEDWLRRFDDKTTTNTVTNLSMPDSTSSTENNTESTEASPAPLPEAHTTIKGIIRDGHTSIVITPAGDKIYLNFSPRPDLTSGRISDKVRSRGEQIFSNMVNDTNTHQAKLSSDLAKEFTLTHQMTIVRGTPIGVHHSTNYGGLYANYEKAVLGTQNSRFEGTGTFMGSDGTPFQVSHVNGIRHEMFHLLEKNRPADDTKAALEQRAIDQVNKFRVADKMPERVGAYEGLKSTEIEAWETANPKETILRNVSRVDDISVVHFGDGDSIYLNFATKNVASVNDEGRNKLEKMMAQLAVLKAPQHMMQNLRYMYGSIENPLNVAYDISDDLNKKGLNVDLANNTILIANDKLGTEARYMGIDSYAHEFHPMDALVHQLSLLNFEYHKTYTNNLESGLVLNMRGYAEGALFYDNELAPERLPNLLAVWDENDIRSEFGRVPRWEVHSHVLATHHSYPWYMEHSKRSYDLVWEGGQAEDKWQKYRNINPWSYTQFNNETGEYDFVSESNYAQKQQRDLYIERIVGGSDHPQLTVVAENTSAIVIPLASDSLPQYASTPSTDTHILFDLNGDGDKYSTEWINRESAFLVTDRNNNGNIDNGTEFITGFEELSTLDSDNNGLFDANDAAFNDVLAWQDSNSDGIAQSEELASLTDVGVEGIATQGVSLGEMNFPILAEGDPTWRTSINSANGEKRYAYRLELSSNSLDREFGDTIDIPEELQDLPDKKGTGKTLRDLREAATLSPELATLLRQFSDATTREEQVAQLDGLIQAWADTADYVQLTDRIDEFVVKAGPDIPIRDNNGRTIGYEPNDTPTDHTLKFRITDLHGGYLSADQLRVGNFVDRPEQDAMYDRWNKPDVEALAKAQVLEVFNDYSFFSFVSYLGEVGSNTWTGWKDGVYGTYHNGGPHDGYMDASALVYVEGKYNSNNLTYGTEDGLSDEIFLDERHLTFSPKRAEKIHLAYDTLKETIYESLVTQTRLSELTDSIEITEADNGNELDFTALKTLIDEKIESDAVNGAADVIDYNKKMASSLVHHGFNGWEQLVNALATTTITAELQQMLDDKVDLVTDSTTFDEEGHKVVLGNEVDNDIADQGNRTYIYSGGGQDSISSRNNHNGVILDGGAGNDHIYMGSSNSTLIGGAGDDTLTVTSPMAENVTFNGGTGTDTLSGSYGKDTYIFNLGDGFDTVIETDDVGQGDTIYFGAGIAGIGQDITVSRDYDGENSYDLLLSHDNGTDQVRIKDWYKDKKFQIEKIEFASGGVWSRDVINERGLTINGSDGKDILVGIGRQWLAVRENFADTKGFTPMKFAGAHYANKLNGGGGIDTLTGGFDSNGDILDGGAESDELKSGNYAKNTTFIGGIGDDTLTGGELNDTYLYNLGDGKDTIYEQRKGNYRSSGVDKLIFGDSISEADITVSRDNLDLVLSHNNGIDQITVKDWFKHYYDAGDFKLEQIEFYDGTVWQAQELTTQLMIQNGDDGADTLTGLDKRYIEIIVDTEVREYTYSNFLVSDANILNGGGGNDTLTSGIASRNDILTGGDGEDTLIAARYSSNTTLEGGAHDDTLIVHEDAKGTILRGGAGEDTLTADWGDSYNNTFEGGTGNDTIEGSRSDDTFIFNMGDDHDTIVGMWGNDVVQFGDGLKKQNFHVSRDDEEGDIYLTFLDEQGNETGDKITLQNALYHSKDNTIEKYTFSDGEIMTREEVYNISHTYQANSAGGDLFGSRQADFIYGSEGSDTLYGLDGEDIIQGGEGDDVLIGGDYRDTYLFNLGDDHDTIIDDGRRLDGGEKNLLKFGVGIGANDISLNRENNDLLLSHSNGNDQVRVQDWYLDEEHQVEVEFANGVTWSTQEVTELEINGNRIDAPVINNAMSDIAIDEDAAFSFQVPVDTFVDDAGSTLSYNATLADGSALPSWLSFNATTQSFSGTPANGDVANLEVKVTATNGSAAAANDVFRLTVNNVNDAPIINNAMSDITVDEDATFSYQIPTTTFIDVDAGDSLTYSATLADGSDLPDWLSFDDDTQSFSGTPTNDDVANLELKVTATDDSGESVSDVFSLNVNNVNDAPTINFVDFQADFDLLFGEGSSYQRIAQGVEFEYTIPQGMIVDPDAGDSLSIQASLIDGSALPTWLNFDEATLTLSGIPNHDYVNQGFPITITATDNNGASTDVQLGFLVLNTNDAPVIINPIADQVLSAGESFTLEPDSVFADVDLEHLFVHDPSDLENRQWETLNYSVTLSDGSALPPWIKVDSVDEKLVFSGRATATVGVTVTATDNAGLTVSDTFMLTTESSDGTAGGPPPLTVNDNYTLNYEAATALVTSTRWYDSTIVSGFNFDLSGHALDLNPVTDYSGIDSAFNFFGYGGGEMESLSDLSGNPTNNSASFELWFRSHDLYEDEVLFETGGYGFLGGGNGTSLVMMDDDNDGWSDDLQFVVKNGSTKRTLTADLSEFLVGARSVTEEFVQVVGTYDRNIGGSTIDEVTLYVNGIEVDYDDATGLNDWANTDDTGLGQVNGSINIGNSNVSNFEGDIAKFRFYEHALSAEDVSANFSAVAKRDADITNVGTDAGETVTGATGHDVIDGGKGNDTLQGLAGNDNYLYSRGDGQDTIIDSRGDADEVNFGDINHDALWFAKSGNDLDITVVGTDDKLTIEDWYSNANARIESFSTTEDSAVLLENQVDQLVSAMAAFNVPSGAGNVIPEDTKDALQPVLASSWS